MGIGDQRVQDQNMPLQISTGDSMSPIASPSPNSRNQFVMPGSKNRVLINNPHSPSAVGFSHPSVNNRQVPVHLQQQRQMQQQKLNQSPFSPQSQTTPQSPNDLFPNSPSNANEKSDEMYIHNSPQAMRPIGQPSPGTPSSNCSPAYSPINPAIRPNLENVYAQAPGTPRPQFSTNTQRSTVYARPLDIFNNPIFQQQNQQQISQQSPQPTDQNQNRQLRDLLQRQQTPTTNNSNLIQSPNFMEVDSSPQSQTSPHNPTSPLSRRPPSTGSIDSGVLIQSPSTQSQSSMMSQNQPQSPQQNCPDNTFRQPLPPGMNRPPRLHFNNFVSGSGTQIRHNISNVQTIQSVDQRNIIISGTGNRPTIAIPQQVMASSQNQQMNQLNNNQQKIMGNFPMSAGQNIGNNLLPSQNVLQTNDNGNGDDLNKMQQNSLSTQTNSIMQRNMAKPNQMSSNLPNQVMSSNSTESVQEIPDSVTAELEKLEQDDNVGIGEVEGVGDILGGLGDDDDDLLGELFLRLVKSVLIIIFFYISASILDSLTAEMGADFNILEYADPELDTTDDEKSNLLDSLELDENEQMKEDVKNEQMESSNKSSIIKPNESIGNLNESSQPSIVPQMQSNQNLFVQPSSQQPNQSIIHQIQHHQLQSNLLKGQAIRITPGQTNVNVIPSQQSINSNANIHSQQIQQNQGQGNPTLIQQAQQVKPVAIQNQQAMGLNTNITAQSQQQFTQMQLNRVKPNIQQIQHQMLLQVCTLNLKNLNFSKKKFFFV